MTAYAVVRVRGDVHLSEDERETFKRLRLTRVNHCVVVPANDVTKGMLQKLVNYITWGEIDRETLDALLKKRGRIIGDEPVTEKYVKEVLGKRWDDFLNAVLDGSTTLTSVGVKPFRLHPPSGGYERGGIKKHFTVGGALGYRGEKINDLLRRMM